jgi:hypothetical protein
MIAPLLAVAADSPPVFTLPIDSPVFWLGTLVLAVPTVIASINGFLSILKYFKADPPDHAVYATKKELESQKNMLLGAINDHSTRIEKRLDEADHKRDGLNSELKQIHAQLGRIFGLLDKPQRSRSQQP